MSHYDLQKIKTKYDEYIAMAQATNRQILPYYEIELWDQVLNSVELKIFEEIRYLGIPLYPIFPITDENYIHFANPYKKIGIEVRYNNSPWNLIKRKVNYLEAQGWKMYIIDSKSTYHTLEEYFRIKRKLKTIEFDDLTLLQQYHFFEKFKLNNIACLLNFIYLYDFAEEFENKNLTM